jgi:hypothetical protein
MATAEQIAANRENARKSTGPRTPAGKARSRYNAMKHGLLAEAALLPEEDEGTFRELERALIEDLAPVGAQEKALVDEIINLTWRLRRDSQVEAGILTRAQANESEEYWTEQARSMEQTWAEFFGLGTKMFRVGDHMVPDVVKSVADGEMYAEASVRAREAAEVQGTPLALLGGAYVRAAWDGDALSKLGRYETQHRRARDRALQTLFDLQDRRCAGEGAGA